MFKRKTHQEFLEEIKDRPFEVIEGVYSGNKVKLKFKCDIDGWEWWAIPSSILRGYGCFKCGLKSRSKKRSKTHEEFLEQIKDKPFLVVEGLYQNDNTHLKFKCDIDGWEWWATPGHILQNRSCPKCAGNIKKTHEQFLEQIKYRPFTLVEGVYYSLSTKLKFKCNKCSKTWIALPNNVLRGTSCPHCKASHGELKVEQWLKDNNIKYETQKKFSNCINTRALPFDFYLPELNTCIEFDGEQHSVPMRFGSRKEYSGLENLIRTMINDEIKDSYCKSHGIKLIRISEINSIDRILHSIFFKPTP